MRWALSTCVVCTCKGSRWVPALVHSHEEHHGILQHCAEKRGELHLLVHFLTLLLALCLAYPANDLKLSSRLDFLWALADGFLLGLDWTHGPVRSGDDCAHHHHGGSLHRYLFISLSYVMRAVRAQHGLDP